jgi:Gas vesicle synthesis protein GvpO.
MSAAEARDLADAAAPGRPLSLVEAMSLARRSVALFTELKVDQVATIEPAEQGGWRVVVDVIEAAARMGDNDLIASYEVILGAQGEVARYARIGRYHRDDAARGGA